MVLVNNRCLFCLFFYKMNSTFAAGDVIVRQVVQNVTEHMQEDEKDSFFLAYALLAVILCLIVSYRARLLYYS